MEDLFIHKLINPKIIIPIAAKCDLVKEKDLPPLLKKLNHLFEIDFFPISAKTGLNINQLLTKIDSLLYSPTTVTERPLALVSRHKKAVTEAISNIKDAIEELNLGNDEVCTMLLRAAYKGISQIQQQNIDDQILNQIFSRFCIGK